MRKLILMALAALLAAASARGQELDSLLERLRQENLSLERLRHEQEASAELDRMENRLEDPRVEYSPFFRRQTSGLYASELIVEQGFDFPTLYAARSKATRLRDQERSAEYDLRQRDLLLEAKLMYLDLVGLRIHRRLILSRLACADSVAAFLSRMESQRQSTVLDLRKAQMEQMTVRASLEENRSQDARLLASLRLLSASEDLSLEAESYPVTVPPSQAELDRYLMQIQDLDAGVAASKAQVRTLEQVISVERQSLLPRLSMGFRRDTEQRTASNGFLVSATLPLFSSQGKVKRAREQLQGSLRQSEELALKVRSEAESDLSQVRDLEKAIRTYDRSLMEKTLEALTTSLNLGQITAVEYFRETGSVWEAMEKLEDLELEYQKALARLKRNDL